MEVKYKRNLEGLIVYLCGELDESSAEFVKNALEKLFDNNLTVKRVVFDLSALKFMDSTGIGTLIGRYKKLKQLGIMVYITGANVAVEKIIHLSGLYTIMPKY
ncbi:MAG: anti-sigma factor antagonist [Clostridia bacterium]|nr:anti-sigma factor antagonist [Clostridia bacterium]